MFHYSIRDDICPDRYLNNRLIIAQELYSDSDGLRGSQDDFIAKTQLKHGHRCSERWKLLRHRSQPFDSKPALG